MELNRKVLEERLRELQTDYDAGLKQLRNLEDRMADLKQTLLRVTGAMQVLRELLGELPDHARPRIVQGEHGAALNSEPQNGELLGR